jgi:septal ring factor EnvC (AmiA/AmiB activator)
MKRPWLVLFLVIPLAVVAQKKPSLNQLRQELKKIEKKKDKAQDQLDAAKEDIRDVRAEIEGVDSRLEKALLSKLQTSFRLRKNGKLSLSDHY